jgi:hypothetical protein
MLGVTAQVIDAFKRVLYTALAAKRGGDCEPCELRVRNQIIRCPFLGPSCSVTALHNVNRHFRARRQPARSPSPERRVLI